MASKAQTSTMKFVYSEAVTRALRQRCRGPAADSTTTAFEDGPPQRPELLLAVLQSGDVDLSVVSGKSGRPTVDADATAAAAAPDDVDYEIANLAEIHRDISCAIEQVLQRSATNDASTASGSVQHDRPITRPTSKIPGEKNKPPTDRSPVTTRTDSDKRRKVRFKSSGKRKSTGE